MSLDSQSGPPSATPQFPPSVQIWSPLVPNQDGSGKNAKLELQSSSPQTSEWHCSGYVNFFYTVYGLNKSWWKSRWRHTELTWPWHSCGIFVPWDTNSFVMKRIQSASPKMQWGRGLSINPCLFLHHVHYIKGHWLEFDETKNQTKPNIKEWCVWSFNYSLLQFTLQLIGPMMDCIIRSWHLRLDSLG